jgi:hypothetical protein
MKSAIRTGGFASLRFYCHQDTWSATLGALLGSSDMMSQESLRELAGKPVATAWCAPEGST